MRNLLARIGDRVQIADISKGTIQKIRFDDSAVEIYTIRLDSGNDYYARHGELTWL